MATSCGCDSRRRAMRFDASIAANSAASSSRATSPTSPHHPRRIDRGASRSMLAVRCAREGPERRATSSSARRRTRQLIRGLGWACRPRRRPGRKAIVIRTGRIGKRTGDRHRLRRARSARSTARITSCGCCRPGSRSIDSTSPSGRRCSSGCSITGTTWTARSSAATRAARSGSGTSCPARISPRYVDYARANASIGINGTVINNVNANARDPDAGVPAEGRGARRRVAAVRRAHVSVGELRGADAARRPEDGRSARPGRRRLVEGQGRRDLQADS